MKVRVKKGVCEIEAETQDWSESKVVLKTSEVRIKYRYLVDDQHLSIIESLCKKVNKLYSGD